jgi:pyrroloquinoline quinone biosynthesis protein B
MKAILLGTAAGGGYPQWNCACPMCAGGYPARTQDCLAISATGRDWYLINASPDIRAQLLATSALRAGPGPRDTPLRGALLTDAELDHTLGLTMLREGSGLQIFAPAAVLTALQDGFPLRPLVARYGSWSWLPVPSELDGMRVTTFPVSDKRPKYAVSSADAADPWVVAYRIDCPTGTLVYAPCLATWPAGFDSFIADATAVILDGTFWSPDELSTTTALPAGAQPAMGHLPIVGPDGTLARRPPGPRWLYTHLNNTNPLLNPGSPEHTTLRAANAEAPPDGTLLTI